MPAPSYSGNVALMAPPDKELARTDKTKNSTLCSLWAHTKWQGNQDDDARRND